MQNAKQIDIEIMEGSSPEIRTEVLTVTAGLQPIQVFQEKIVDKIIEELEAKAAEFQGDVSTAKGRAEIKSFAMKFSKTKTLLEDLRKDLTEDWKNKKKLVDTQGKRIVDTCDRLRDEVKKEVIEFEERETKRIQDFEDKIAYILSFQNKPFNQTSIEIEADIAEITILKGIDWQEFLQRASSNIELMLTFLNKKLSDRLAFEKEQKELEEFRIEKAKKEQEEREAAIAEAARKEAEEQAAKAAEEAEAKHQAELKAQEQAAEAAKLAAELAEQTAKEEAERLEKELAQQKIQAEQDKIAAEEAAKLAAEKAEKEKQEAIEKARAEEAARIEAERKAEEAAAAKLAASKAHQRKINSEAVADLMDNGFNETEAQLIVTLVAKKLIRNITINY